MSTLIESLAQDRHAARYQAAAQRRSQLAAPRETDACDAVARETVARETAIRGIAASTRTRAGWLLIGLGLRLALRGGDTPAHRARLLGQ